MAEQLYMQDMAYNERDNWAEQANCRGKAFELFEYQEKDSPLVKGMTYRQRVEFNRSNFEQAEEICIECPVFFECKANAQESDRQWTMRGGEIPSRFDYELRSGEAQGGGRTCQKGHYTLAGGRCKACKSDAARIRRENAKKNKGS